MPVNLAVDRLRLPQTTIPNVAAAFAERDKAAANRAAFGLKERQVGVQEAGVANQAAQLRFQQEKFQKEQEQKEIEKMGKRINLSLQIVAGVRDQASNAVARKQLLTIGVPQENIDALVSETFDPANVKNARTRLRAAANKFKPFILSPGQVAIDPTTREEVARGPEKIPTPTNLSKLISERDALSPDDPRRTIFDQAIRKQTTRPGEIIEVGPDGTVSIRRGAAATGARAPGIGIAVSNKLDEAILNATAGISRVNRITKNLDDDFLTIKGKFKAVFLNLKDKAQGLLGIKKLTEDEATFLEKSSRFAQNAVENINLYIKEITGAQMSEAEAKRLRKAIADIGDSFLAGDGPIKFRAKLGEQLAKLNVSVARLFYIKKHGFTITRAKADRGEVKKGDATGFFDDRGNAITLERMPGIMSKRESEIMTKFKKDLPGRTQGEYDQLTLDRLSEEFGLVGT